MAFGFPVTTPTPGAVFSAGMKALSPSPRQRQMIRAWRYYDGTAYDPSYARQFPHPFQEWDEVQNGPRPTVQKLPKRLIEIGAQFLFSEPPRFSAVDSDEEEKENTLQDFIDDVLTMNVMAGKWLTEARACAVEGGTVFKFAWTPDNLRRPVSVQTLSPADVTFLRDDLDADRILSARVQFKFFSVADDKWYLFREDWTPDIWIQYELLETNSNDDAAALRAGLRQGEWPIKKRQANPFGVIPLTPIHNRIVKGDTEGVGDFWDVFPELDAYNYKMWLEHRSDQLDADRILVILNDDTFDGAIKPGMGLKIRGQDADAKWLESGNNIRPDLKISKDDLRKMIFDSVGVDDVDPATITNKGNLTRAVWEMVYGKTIKSTLEKRAYWGQAGLEIFWENLLVGLARLPDAKSQFPALKKVKPDDFETYDVQLQWPDLFRSPPDEVGLILNNLNLSVTSGYLTPDRAVEISARAWDIADVSILKEELKEKHEQMKQIDEAAADLAVNEAANAGKPDAPTASK